MTPPTREPGGPLPPFGVVLSETIADFSANLEGHLMVGLAYFAAVLPVALLSGMLAGFGAMVTMAAGVAASFTAQGGAEGEPDGGVALVFLVGTFVVGGLVIAGSILVLATVLAPLNASVRRAVAAHQRGEAPLTFQAALSTLTRDLGATLGVALVSGCASLLGMFLCYVGAFLPGTLFLFATDLSAIGGLGAMEALRRSSRDAARSFGEHLLFTLLYVGLVIVGANIPVVGMAFLVSFHVRAYRKVYGDGPIAA